MVNGPVLLNPIPNRVVNEGASFGPLDLKEFIQSGDDRNGGPLIFQAELADARPLPKGLICTQSGIISGIPAEGTAGEYEILIQAKNDADVLTTPFRLTIKARIKLETGEFFGDLKSRVWEALGSNLPLPEIGDLLQRPVTAVEVYYLLQRFGTFTIWDVYNLDPPGESIPLQLEGCSKHYNIFDRGSCIVAAPKDLFSHERNLEDSLQTARAVAREVYKRGWVIEFGGFDKMVRAAWIELQILGNKYGKEMEILHYTPSAEDVRLYSFKATSPELKL